MKYLKKFQKEADYQSFVTGDTFVTPNVSFAKEENLVFYNPYEKEEEKIPNNVIRYTGSNKLPETTTNSSSGLHTNAFNTAIVSHDFADGVGTITFEKDVTYVGNYAFSGCTSLTSIVVPDSVTSIGNSAFDYCSGLTSVVIPNSVISIGSSAFQYCKGLTGELVIPDSVTSIENTAFFYCDGLTSVTIGSGVTSIGDGAFSYCSGLASIVVSSGNTVYDSRKNCNCIIETATNKLIHAYKNSFIPDSVTSIGYNAFSSCSGLTGELVIPDSVTSIENTAFLNCSGLTSVTMGSGVTSIGNSAFAYCSGLTSITCYATTAPTISNKTFRKVKSNGVLYYPSGSDYSSWLLTNSYYLGYYNWTGQEIS